MGKRLNVNVSDETIALLEACVEDSEATFESEYIRSLIREDAERRGISLDSTNTEKQGEAEFDDSDEFTEEELTKDELEVLADVANEINPEHVPAEAISQANAVSILTAMARHEYSDIDRADVEELCERVGLAPGQSSDSSSDGDDIPAQVVERIRSTDPEDRS